MDRSTSFPTSPKSAPGQKYLRHVVQSTVFAALAGDVTWVQKKFLISRARVWRALAVAERRKLLEVGR